MYFFPPSMMIPVFSPRGSGRSPVPLLPPSAPALLLELKSLFSGISVCPGGRQVSGMIAGEIPGAGRRCLRCLRCPLPVLPAAGRPVPGSGADTSLRSRRSSFLRAPGMGRTVGYWGGQHSPGSTVPDQRPPRKLRGGPSAAQLPRSALHRLLPLAGTLAGMHIHLLYF